MPCALELPPGFRVRVAGDPWACALEEAGEPGSVFWDGSDGRCRAAYVFAPDRAVGPDVIRQLGLLALFDALALLAPPRKPMVVLGDALLVDGGRVARVRSAQGPGLIPDWAVLGLDVALDLQRADPGATPVETCLMEEGFGAVTAPDLLARTSRHLLAWLDIWTDEGAPALARKLAERSLVSA